VKYLAGVDVYSFLGCGRGRGLGEEEEEGLAGEPRAGQLAVW